MNALAAKRHQLHPSPKHRLPIKTNPNNTQMKLKTTLASFLSMVAIATSHAFVIDFDSGSVLPSGTNIVGQPTISSGSPLTVDVTGYGTVTFSVASESVSVDTNFAPGAGVAPEQTLEFYGNNVVTVTFDDDAPLKPSTDNNGFVFGQAGDDSENSADRIVSSAISDNVYELSLSGSSGAGAGLTYIAWDVVPEPSSTALGALGLGILLLKRRRA